MRSHLLGRVTLQELKALDGWLTPAQRSLFDSMHRADQRHGLDVVASLRAAGHREPDLLLAGLLHDAGKGPDVGLRHRVAWSLGERYGPSVLRIARHLPGFGVRLERIARHAEASAELCLAAGCSARTADLIRHQAQPLDPQLGEALRLADAQN